MKKCYEKIALSIIEIRERDVIRMSSDIAGDFNAENSENLVDGGIWWW
jgi:hypothetical protein